MIGILFMSELLNFKFVKLKILKQKKKLKYMTNIAFDLGEEIKLHTIEF